MRQLRRATDRGHADHGWLDTWHTFSFADYQDSRHMGFRTLRVMNEDKVTGGTGFGSHPHRDMEIVTCVLSGALEHSDSMGHGAVLRPGEMQRITAGKGMLHSEFNPSATEPVHLYQVWITPRARGLTPSYEQKAFDPAQRRNRLQLVASPDGADGSLTIQQDARLYLADLDVGKEVEYSIPTGNGVWLQVVRGEVEVNGDRLGASDGMAVEGEGSLTVRASEAAEFMMFDLR